MFLCAGAALCKLPFCIPLPPPDYSAGCQHFKVLFLEQFLDFELRGAGCKQPRNMPLLHAAEKLACAEQAELEPKALG